MINAWLRQYVNIFVWVFLSTKTDKVKSVKNKVNTLSSIICWSDSVYRRKKKTIIVWLIYFILRIIAVSVVTDHDWNNSKMNGLQ